MRQVGWWLLAGKVNCCPDYFIHDLQPDVSLETLMFFFCSSVQLTIGDEFYYDDDGEVANMLSTSQSGRFTGLTVIFDVQIDDYPSWSQANYGAMVLLSDPHDFQEITVSINYALPGQSVDLKVEPLVYRTESNVRTVDVDKRNCWFSDEIRLAYTERESISKPELENKNEATFEIEQDWDRSRQHDRST
ncbi:Pickpocket protein 28 [Eumeta japonica]|uniref:Pickpocket protein 28 n=1 Tax=Eumeta variegata TaxID=151549 RepID=A0A4C1ZYF5_EUMVA|nr:Pickpocket protein 28 [Eumeta japonica]